MFPPVPSASFPKLEEEVLQFWKEQRIYDASLARRASAPRFVFYEGPPTANGLPHPGHCLTRAIKDLFPRYKTMRGYLCERKAGWDTHGLPVEVEVCKEMGIHSKEEIEAFGIEPFIHKCQASVWRYMQEWEKLTERIGFWVDLQSAYVTYHQSYVESVWWSLKNLFDRGLLYQGHKIVWWWAQGGTALSAGEVGQGYREVADPSVYVKFPLVEEGDGVGEKEARRVSEGNTQKTSLLVWTTTPWTLPSNQFAAVHPDLDYATVLDTETGERLIMAAALVETIAGKVKRELKVEGTCKGSALVGKRYLPPFDFYYQFDGNTKAFLKDAGKDQYSESAGDTQEFLAWRIVPGGFVTTDSGTGAVHIAPAFGEVDYEVLMAERVRFTSGPELINAVGPDGKFTGEVRPLACIGRWVKDCDKDITRDLKDRGLLYHQEQYLHDYPFCWRADQDPLIQYPRKSWFIKTTAFKDAMLANNEQINWLPEHIKHGRFGNFLETNVDWALSRERYWGTPLPIWVCEKTGQMEAIGGYEELLTKPGLAGTEVWDAAKQQNPALVEDLKVHKPYIDAITYDSPFAPGARMQRVTEVIDCWYDSGAMPFAQWGYRGESGPATAKAKFREQFPADFISEALDQTRGWFYSQLAISTMLFGEGKEDGGQGTGEKTNPKSTPQPQSSTSGNETYGEDAQTNQGRLTHLLNIPIGDFDLSDRVRGLLQEKGIHMLGDMAHISEQDLLNYVGDASLTNLRSRYPHPFRNCIVLGLMLGEDGQKMSKSKRNYREPREIFDKFGADALRWYFFANQPPWTSIRYAERAIKDSIPEFLLRLWNCFSFFTIYANIDGFDPAQLVAAKPQASGGLQLTADDFRGAQGYRPYAERNELDRWILSELNRTLAAVVERMDAYDNFEACKRINEYVDGLSNWFVRRSRDRFWAKMDATHQADKLDAYWTLYECLLTTAKMIAPFTPFLAETLWRNLTATFASNSQLPAPSPLGSVHLCDYPVADTTAVDQTLSARMQTLREIASLGLSARMANKLKVRQPLSRVEVILSDATHQKWLEEHDELLRDELNVKQIEYAKDATKYITYQVQPNFKKLGPRLGKFLPECKAVLGKADGGVLLAEMTAKGKVTLTLGGEPVELDGEDIQVRLNAKPGWAAAQGRGVVVVLATELTPDLIREGYANDLVRLIQDARKELALEYTDRIDVGLVTDSVELRTAIEENRDYVCGETLTDTLTFAALNGVNGQESELGESKIVLFVKKAG